MMDKLLRFVSSELRTWGPIAAEFAVLLAALYVLMVVLGGSP